MDKISAVGEINEVSGGKVQSKRCEVHLAPMSLLRAGTFKVFLFFKRLV